MGSQRVKQGLATEQQTQAFREKRLMWVRIWKPVSPTHAPSPSMPCSVPSPGSTWVPKACFCLSGSKHSRLEKNEVWFSLSPDTMPHLQLLLSLASFSPSKLAVEVENSSQPGAQKPQKLRWGAGLWTDSGNREGLDQPPRRRKCVGPSAPRSISGTVVKFGGVRRN